MSVQNYDVIIVGGGHAGAEASWAASRLGARVALITMQVSAIGRMSCNPAIGGLGKGHMVREIDALGGLMAQVIDATGIQFRTLNASKGPAVQAPRAQADRQAYANEVRSRLADVSNITFIEGSVSDFLTRAADSGTRRCIGVVLEDGRRVGAESVVVTTGTFMRALMHCGATQTAGGRVGEAASTGLSGRLESLGVTLGRLKTGTPPRIHRDSIDYDLVEPQPGDDAPKAFSYLTTSISRPQVCCWIAYTGSPTHELIRDHLHEAPMFSGQIRSHGPRYCPSIEDKVVRFPDKSRHQVFLEPEGYDDERIYCNGISTSLPSAVQTEMVRSIEGLRRAEIIQPGYAVEYDFVPTYQTKITLELKNVARLFLAGQINGTSGYEEAAAQGLVAGVNAVRAIDDRAPFVLGRDEAYIGVMVDDLVTKPPTEPYRMFTSRAEYRLHLRCDNADRRLTAIGRGVGLVDDVRWTTFQSKLAQIQEIESLVAREKSEGKPLVQWLRRPDYTMENFESWLAASGHGTLDPTALRQVQIDARYSGYILRQQEQIKRFRRLETMTIPATMDFARVAELRLEARESLALIRPRTLGQAGRMSGITPADVAVLWVLLSRRNGSSRTT